MLLALLTLVPAAGPCSQPCALSCKVGASHADAKGIGCKTRAMPQACPVPRASGRGKMPDFVEG